MANVYNIDTNEYFESVDTLKFLNINSIMDLPSNWLLNPDISQVKGYDTKYWTYVNSQIVLISEEERNAIDALGEFYGLPLPDAKRLRCDQINTMREYYINGGFIFQGNPYDSDQRSRENIAGACNLVALGMSLPEGFCWRSSNNQNIPFDIPKLVTMGASLLNFVNSVYAASWTKKLAWRTLKR